VQEQNPSLRELLDHVLKKKRLKITGPFKPKIADFVSLFRPGGQIPVNMLSPRNKRRLRSLRRQARFLEEGKLYRQTKEKKEKRKQQAQGNHVQGKKKKRKKQRKLTRIERSIFRLRRRKRLFFESFSTYFQRYQAMRGVYKWPAYPITFRYTPQIAKQYWHVKRASKALVLQSLVGKAVFKRRRLYKRHHRRIKLFTQILNQRLRVKLKPRRGLLGGGVLWNFKPTVKVFGIVLSYIKYVFAFKNRLKKKQDRKRWPYNLTLRRYFRRRLHIPKFRQLARYRVVLLRSLNNVFFSGIRVNDGMILNCLSAGDLGIKGSRRTTQLTAERVGRALGVMLLRKRVRLIDVCIRSHAVDRYVKTAIGGLLSAFVRRALRTKHGQRIYRARLRVKNILFDASISHNGMRRVKPRRV